MKRNEKLFKIATISSLFVLGVSLINYHDSTPIRVEATQHLGDYDPYTYSGNYYNGINFDAAGGMNGALRQSLTTLIRPAGFYTYGSSGETHLATQLQYADEDPTNSSKMVYLYTRDSVTKNAASSWNREHCWPQSLSNNNWGTSEGGTDILHLRPTYPNTNSSRGNTPYGNANKATAKYFNSMLYGYTGNGYFEPIDSVKGDVARIIMYVWTTYTNYKSYNALNILTVFQSYDTLLTWHTQDKPDVLEGNRNDYCQTSRQQNRNPFVDHPELAWKIFGDNASDNVKNACMQAYPANGSGGDPIEPTGIRLNKSSASIEEGKTLQLSATLQPNGATGSVSWSSNNTGVALVNSNGLVTAVSQGNATITATVGGYSASCNITVTALVNNYGTLDNPLNITDAKEIIDGAGNNQTAQPLYVRGIVSSNTAYNTEYYNYDEVWLASDDGSEEQSFLLGRVKLDNSIQGDYSAENSMQDYEVVAYGYGKKYNDTYELWTSSSVPKNPLIMSINPPTATAISLNQTEAEIDVGDAVTLTATLTPSNSNSAYTWESSNENIATVEDGVVTGVSSGVATITAKVSDDIEAECVVTVIDQSSQQPPVTLFTADLTDTMSVDNSFAISSGSVTKKTGYYQDNGTADTSVCFFKVLGTSPLFASTPTGITFTANLGAGSAKNPLSHDVEVCLVDSSGNDIAATRVTLTSQIAKEETEYEISVPYNANAYGAKISHIKADGHNIRYYSFSLISSFGGPSTPSNYLTSASVFATLHATENIVSEAATDSINFASLGLTSGQKYADPFSSESDVFTVTFAGGSNDGRYYDTGTGIRTYGNGTITISSTEEIKQITLVWHSSYKPESNSVANVGTYNVDTGVWTGSSTSVTFTRPDGSGHWRLQSVTATCGEDLITYEENSVALRFGASIPTSDWDAIAAKWEISDYGVMLFKQLQSPENYSDTPVQDVFRDGGKLSIIHKGSGEAPTEEDGRYPYTAQVNIKNPTSYNVVICAAPFIVIEDTYYFLGEMQYSVNSLAKYYQVHGGSGLSDSTLSVLAGE